MRKKSICFLASLYLGMSSSISNNKINNYFNDSESNKNKKSFKLPKLKHYLDKKNYLPPEFPLIDDNCQSDMYCKNEKIKRQPKSRRRGVLPYPQQQTDGIKGEIWMDQYNYITQAGQPKEENNKKAKEGKSSEEASQQANQSAQMITSEPTKSESYYVKGEIYFPGQSIDTQTNTKASEGIETEQNLPSSSKIEDQAPTDQSEKPEIAPGLINKSQETEKTEFSQPTQKPLDESGFENIKAEGKFPTEISQQHSDTSNIGIMAQPTDAPVPDTSKIAGEIFEPEKVKKSNEETPKAETGETIERPQQTSGDKNIINKEENPPKKPLPGTVVNGQEEQIPEEKVSESNIKPSNETIPQPQVNHPSESIEASGAGIENEAIIKILVRPPNGYIEKKIRPQTENPEKLEDSTKIASTIDSNISPPSEEIASKVSEGTMTQQTCGESDRNISIPISQTNKTEEIDFITQSGTFIANKLPFDFKPAEQCTIGWSVIPNTYWVNEDFKNGYKFIVIKSQNSFLACDSQGKAYVTQEINNTILFKVELVGENIVHLKSNNSGYLSINEDGSVDCKNPKIDYSNQLGILQTNKDCPLDEPNYILVRATNGRYLTIQDELVTGENNESEFSLFKGPGFEESQSKCKKILIAEVTNEKAQRIKKILMEILKRILNKNKILFEKKKKNELNLKQTKKLKLGKEKDGMMNNQEFGEDESKKDAQEGNSQPKEDMDKQQTLQPIDQGVEGEKLNKGEDKEKEKLDSDNGLPIQNQNDLKFDKDQQIPSTDNKYRIQQDLIAVANENQLRLKEQQRILKENQQKFLEQERIARENQMKWLEQQRIARENHIKLQQEQQRIARENQMKLFEQQRIARENQMKLQEQQRNARENQMKFQEQQRIARESQIKLQQQQMKERENQLRMRQEQERIARENQLKLQEQERIARENQMKLQEQQRKERENQMKLQEEQRIARENQMKLQEEQRIARENQLKLQEQERIARENQLKLQEQQKEMMRAKESGEGEFGQVYDSEIKLKVQDRKIKEKGLPYNLLRMEKQKRKILRQQLEEQEKNLKALRSEAKRLRRLKRIKVRKPQYPYDESNY